MLLNRDFSELGSTIDPVTGLMQVAEQADHSDHSPQLG